jgi:hypothetical protein
VQFLFRAYSFRNPINTVSFLKHCISNIWPGNIAIITFTPAFGTLLCLECDVIIRGTNILYWNQITQVTVKFGQDATKYEWSQGQLGTENYVYISYDKQEVLGRTNRLLSLIRHGPHRKRRVQQVYCCVCIHYRGSVSAEPLPSNGKGIHRLMGGIYEIRCWDGLRCHDILYIPSFIKIGSAWWSH